MAMSSWLVRWLPSMYMAGVYGNAAALAVPAVPSAVTQRVAGQEQPGAGDVQDVDVLAGVLRDGVERCRHARDLHRGVVEHALAAGLDDLDAVDASVAVDGQGEDELAVDVVAAGLLRIVEVADALQACVQIVNVGGVEVFLGLAGNELPARAAGIGLAG